MKTKNHAYRYLNDSVIAK